MPVAVRSSATAEDTAATSFAGMNETFLNIRGADAVIDAVRRCWRSLFGARTIYYRGVNGFAQADMDIAVVVQRQVASTRAGVMFTVNPATGERDELVIEGSFGLGEAVVSGSVSPDRYMVEKATLAIRRREVHHKDLVIEYDPDGRHPPARPLARRRRCARCSATRRSSLSPSSAGASSSTTTPRRTPSGRSTPTACCGCCRAVRSPRSMNARSPHRGSATPAAARARRPCCCTGWAAHQAAPAGAARVLTSLADAASLNDGDVLVTHMTSPDWLPLLRRAGAIVTDSGGMTCHAAIVSRELGIPCVVGTGEATRKLRDGEIVTVDATRGVVLEGCPSQTPWSASPRPVPPASGPRAQAPAPPRQRLR